jgi:hypothetical protein
MNTEEALIRNEQRFRYLITAIGDILRETDAQAPYIREPTGRNNPWL